MARLGEEMIADAMLALSERHEDFSEKVFRSEEHMNALEMEVDETLLAILSIEEEAVDPRFILVAAQINQDIERIGDHAVSIAKSAVELSSRSYMKILPSISVMAEQTSQMLSNAVESFVEKNLEIAKGVIAFEGEIGGIGNGVMRNLIKDMSKRSQFIEHTIILIRVCKILECIAELAANVAERVMFMSDLPAWKQYTQNAEDDF